MIYHKYIWVVGIVFVIMGFMGLSQGKLFSGLGFFPIAVSIFVSYDKRNPKVENAKLRDAIFLGGMIVAAAIWVLGPKLFPNL